MSKLSRRAMFPLFAAGGVLAANGSQGASMEIGVPGIVVRLMKSYGGWSVLVPDFECMNGYWIPGMMVPTKWMPVADYLKLLDETYNMEA